MTTEIIRNVSSLKNEVLKRDLEAMESAMYEGKRSTWKYAYHLSRIINSKSFVEDFENQKNFAEFIGLSPATITQQNKAVKFAAEHELLDVTKPNFDIDISVKNAYLLSSVSDLTAFELWAEINGIDTYHCTSAELTKAIAAWKATLIPMSEPTDEAENVDTESAENVVSDGKRNKIIQKIIKMMCDNDITLNDIENVINESVES